MELGQEIGQANQLVLVFQSMTGQFLIEPLANRSKIMGRGIILLKCQAVSADLWSEKLIEHCKVGLSVDRIIEEVWTNDLG